MEVTHALVLFRHCHRLEVALISDSLEVATDQEQIYFVLLLCFQILNVTVNCVKLPMTAAFYGNLDSTLLNNILKYRMCQLNLHFNLLVVLFRRDSNF